MKENYYKLLLMRGKVTAKEVSLLGCRKERRRDVVKEMSFVISDGFEQFEPLGSLYRSPPFSTGKFITNFNIFSTGLYHTSP